MPNGDPRDRFFYPNPILMIDFYNLLGEKDNYFASVVYLLYCGYLYCLSLPCSALGWSVICGISSHAHELFLLLITLINVNSFS